MTQLKCIICVNPKRLAIDADLRAGLSMREIATRHNVDKSTVHRHSKHIPLDDRVDDGTEQLPKSAKLRKSEDCLHEVTTTKVGGSVECHRCGKKWTDRTAFESARNAGHPVQLVTGGAGKSGNSGQNLRKAANLSERRDFTVKVFYALAKIYPTLKSVLHARAAELEALELPTGLPPPTGLAGTRKSYNARRSWGERHGMIF